LALTDPPAVFAADHSRALAFGFVSREPALPQESVVGSGRPRLLGFGPVNQPRLADCRPRYSCQKGRSIAQASPAMGFLFLSQVIRHRLRIRRPQRPCRFARPTSISLVPLDSGHRSLAATSGAHPLMGFSTSRFGTSSFFFQMPP